MICLVLISSTVIAEDVTCWIESIENEIPGTDPPAQCAGGHIDVKTKLTYQFEPVDLPWCFLETLDVDANINLWEQDATMLDDDYLNSSPTLTQSSYSCEKKTFSYTFEDLHLGSWATGDAGDEIELILRCEGSSEAGTSTDTTRLSAVDVKVIDGDCASGACCNTNTCYYKSFGSQPSGYADGYSCEGSNSATGTNYVKKLDYYCNGNSANAQSTSTTQDTCGVCEYCTAGDSTCNYYSSSTSCGTKDCDYLDTSCINYHDTDKYCNGAGTCVAGSCDSYTYEAKHTSCGTGKECNGDGSCITCTSHDSYDCSDGDVYWYDKCDNREEKKNECGDSSYSGWQYYCNGKDLRKKRNYYDRYCSSNNCRLDVIEQDEKVKTCQYECELNSVEQGQCKEICYDDDDCGSEFSYGAHCSGGNLYMYYSTPNCQRPGQVDSSCTWFEEERVVQYCRDGCTDGDCNDLTCTDKCVYNQKRCSGNYQQTCGNYDSDVCREWPLSTSGTGNEYCEFGCENNACIPEIACYLDCDCSGAFCIWNGAKMCVDEDVTDDDGGDVWQYGQAFKRCINPGTKEAYCTDGPGMQMLRKKIECGHTVCEEDGEQFCWSGKSVKNVWCNFVGCQTGTYSCYQSTGTKMIILKECQQGCTDGTCNEDFCYDSCGDGQKRCNGNYEQVCGKYDSDPCWDWPSSTSGAGNSYCQNGCSNDACICITHSYSTCYSGDSYWYDNCGNKEEKKEECGSKNCYNGACMETFSFSFKKGWNSIAFPLKLKDNTVKNVFSQYSKIITYAGKWIELGDNDKINESLGYWVKMNNANNLNIEGDYIGDWEVNSNSDWQFFAYQSDVQRNIVDMPDLKDKIIYYYDSSKWLSYIPGKSDNTLTIVKPGNSYWVKVG